MSLFFLMVFITAVDIKCLTQIKTFWKRYQYLELTSKFVSNGYYRFQEYFITRPKIVITSTWGWG